MSRRRPATKPITRTCEAGCDRPAVDAFVCGTCVDGYSRDLHALPGLCRELRLEMARLARKTTGPATKTAGGKTQPLPYDPHAADALNRIRNELVGAVRVLCVDPARMPPDTEGGMAAWLIRNLAAVPLRPEAGDIITGLTRAITAAKRIIDTPPERRYIGRCVCGGDTEPERTKLYATTRDRYHRCPECGTQWDVAQRLADLHQDLADYLLTPAEVELATGGRVSAERVRKWRERGQIGASGGRYRYGDVLAAEAQRTTRTVGA